jgi:cyclopropane fatty-acyl-phospholipid synthase-like methyltransferase
VYSKTAPFHGFIYSGDGESEARADFVVSQLVGGSRELIVDVGAGVGGLAFAMVRRGIRAIALEESPVLFGILLERFRADRSCWSMLSPLPISLSDLPADLSPDAIVASNLMSHLSPEQKIQFLTESTLRLRSRGGVLIFNCVQRSPHRPKQGRAEISKRVYGENILRHFAASDFISSGSADVVVTSEVVVEHRGKKLRSFCDKTLLYFDHYDDVQTQLRALGIESWVITGGWADTPYQSESPGFVVVAHIEPN